MRRILLLVMIILTGCNPFGGDDPTPTPIPETPTPVVIDLPTPTPLPVAPPAGEDTVSLLDTAAPPLADELLPTVEPQAVQMPRFSAGDFSFVPSPGWAVMEPGNDVYIVHRAGWFPFNGSTNMAPYVYLKAIPDVGNDAAALQTALDSLVLANLAGAQTTEPMLGIVIDGVTGVWQFVDGRNDNGQYRAFLLVIPTGESTLAAVVWSTVDDWAIYADEMANVLETMRFPKG